MKSIVIASMAFMTSVSASAATENFDESAPGTLPAGWIAGVTGTGDPRWAVDADHTAPSPPQVLKQAGRGAFPWCVKRDVSLADGYVEVKFKPMAGLEDRAAGVVWRWRDGSNYFVARANALANNVSLYYVENARRRTIGQVEALVVGNVWHALRVDFVGRKIRVAFDGRVYLDLADNHVAPGAVGVWTKADSVTVFDDFRYGGISSK